MSHIDRTNKDPTIYKAKPKAIILCLCVEHREFKVTWTKLLDEWVWPDYLQRFWPTKTEPAATDNGAGEAVDN